MRGFALKGCLGVVILAILAFAGVRFLAYRTVVGMDERAAMRTPEPPTASPTLAPPEPDARRDVDVKVNRCYSGGFGTVALLDLTLKNMSATFEYSDIGYKSVYTAESGSVLRSNAGVLSIVLKPKQQRRYEAFNDGLLPQQVGGCDVRIVGYGSSRTVAKR